MKIWESFGPIIDGLVIDVDVTRCFKLLPYTTKENAEELVLMAAHTSWSGFEDNIRNLKGLKGHDECPHEEWVNICRCKKCGFSKEV
jgi:hypothetical protein